MPKNLLVADDSLTIRKVIGMIFATEDFQITAVDNGIEAIQKTRELRPDLVLADVVMPGKSGYEVCEALKADPATQGIPVMLLAGTFEAFDEGRAKAARADDHIMKPFESQALLDKVKALVGVPSSKPLQTMVPTATVSRPAPPVATGPGQRPSMQMPMPGGPPPGAGLPGPRPMMTPPQGVRPLGPMPGGPGGPQFRGPGMPQQGIPGPGARPSGIMPMPGMPGPGARPSGIMPMPGVPGPRPGAAPNTGAFPRAPGMPPPGMPGPGVPMPGVGIRPSGTMMPGMTGPAPAGAFGRPPGPGGMPPGGAPRRPDPFGLGAPAQQQPPRPRAPDPGVVIDDSMPERRGAEEIALEVPGNAAPPRARAPADGGEAQLREALSRASREVIEKIAWEVVPQLAETIIRQELDRLIKDRETKN